MTSFHDTFTLKYIFPFCFIINTSYYNIFVNQKSIIHYIKLDILHVVYFDNFTCMFCHIYGSLLYLKTNLSIINILNKNDCIIELCVKRSNAIQVIS